MTLETVFIIVCALLFAIVIGGCVITPIIKSKLNEKELSDMAVEH
jgi:hypothetical protein